MVPDTMLQPTDEQHLAHFFEQHEGRWTIKQTSDGTPLPATSTPIVPSANPTVTLKEIVSKDSSQKKKYSPEDKDQIERSYDWFVDLIRRMLTYRPQDRISPSTALEHPFITNQGVG